MFPSMDENDAKLLALSGLYGTSGFKDQMAGDMNCIGTYEATQLAYTKGTKGARCK